MLQELKIKIKNDFNSDVPRQKKTPDIEVIPANLPSNSFIATSVFKKANELSRYDFTKLNKNISSNWAEKCNVARQSEFGFTGRAC